MCSVCRGRFKDQNHLNRQGRQARQEKRYKNKDAKSNGSYKGTGASLEPYTGPVTLLCEKVLSHFSLWIFLGVLSMPRSF